MNLIINCGFFQLSVHNVQFFITFFAYGEKAGEKVEFFILPVFSRLFLTHFPIRPYGKLLENGKFRPSYHTKPTFSTWDPLRRIFPNWPNLKIMYNSVFLIQPTFIRRNISGRLPTLQYSSLFLFCSVPGTISTISWDNLSKISKPNPHTCPTHLIMDESYVHVRFVANERQR